MNIFGAKKKSEGFTLLELLVSIGIIGFLLGAILKSQAQLVYVEDTASRRSIAQSEITRMLTKIERDESAIRGVAETGVFKKDSELTGMSWELKQDQLEILQQPMRRIVYRVLWQDRGRQSSLDGSILLAPK